MLFVFTRELVILEDICLLISCASYGKIPALNFRFWLNAKYLPATKVIVNSDVTLNDFVCLSERQKDCYSLMRENDSYLKMVHFEGKREFSSLGDVTSLIVKRIGKF